jgi:hypothetical protein
MSTAPELCTGLGWHKNNPRPEFAQIFGAVDIPNILDAVLKPASPMSLKTGVEIIDIIASPYLIFLFLFLIDRFFVAFQKVVLTSHSSSQLHLGIISISIVTD